MDSCPALSTVHLGFHLGFISDSLCNWPVDELSAVVGRPLNPTASSSGPHPFTTGLTFLVISSAWESDSRATVFGGKIFASLRVCTPQENRWFSQEIVDA
jgi:hypothetical protein